MPHRFIRPRLLAVAAIAGLAVACGGGGASGDLDKVEVMQTQFEIVVHNISGKALMDVLAEIKPAGPSSHYTTRIARLENGEKRGIAHTSFHDRDHVPFSARTAKATLIIVSAKDIDGNAIRVELPFKK
ncbi:MAG TPA: hypothetical protein PLE61_10545 [Vicinamibacterales bacterium]|nr:hypothetical protein [Vicinamibacterales bacterium]